MSDWAVAAFTKGRIVRVRVHFSDLKLCHIAGLKLSAGARSRVYDIALSVNIHLRQKRQTLWPIIKNIDRLERKWALQPKPPLFQSCMVTFIRNLQNLRRLRLHLHSSKVWFEDCVTGSNSPELPRKS